MYEKNTHSNNPDMLWEISVRKCVADLSTWEILHYILSLLLSEDTFSSEWGFRGHSFLKDQREDNRVKI